MTSGKAHIDFYTREDSYSILLIISGSETPQFCLDEHSLDQTSVTAIPG